MSPDDPRHGSYRGSRAHQRDGEEPCDPCREARNTYIREHRAGNPDSYEREKRMARARGRAAWRLTRMHPALFWALVQEELDREEAA